MSRSTIRFAASLGWVITTTIVFGPATKILSRYVFRVTYSHTRTNVYLSRASYTGAGTMTVREKKSPAPEKKRYEITLRNEQKTKRLRNAKTYGRTRRGWNGIFVHRFYRYCSNKLQRYSRFGISVCRRTDERKYTVDGCWLLRASYGPRIGWSVGRTVGRWRRELASRTSFAPTHVSCAFFATTAAAVHLSGFLRQWTINT